MTTDNTALDTLSVRELELIRTSAIDQAQTAQAGWHQTIASNQPLESTLAWVNSLHAAERRIDRINAELGRRQRGATA